MNKPEQKRRGSFGEYLTNLNAPYPLPTKLWMIARNLSLRFTKRQACCGHPGEPGC